MASQFSTFPEDLQKWQIEEAEAAKQKLQPKTEAVASQTNDLSTEGGALKADQCITSWHGATWSTASLPTVHLCLLSCFDGEDALAKNLFL